MQYCQLIVDGDRYLAIAASRFASVEGLVLATFTNRYAADSYVSKANALARAYRGGRAKDAKEKT